MNSYLTVAEAVQFTGKSRRTITRLAVRLAQAGSDQVMREKTARGYIWRISQSSLQNAFGAKELPSASPLETTGMATPLSTHPNAEHTVEVFRHGYAGIMTMHQEVKQAYEALLEEKERRIVALSQELAQRRKGLWRWFFDR